MVASSNSMELGVLGATNDTWTQWILNDNARAELPLSASKNDTLPVGMALNFGTSKSLLIGENDMPPFPLLLLLSNYGILCCFYVVNLKPDIPNMHIPPENIPDKSGINLFIKPVSIKPPSAIQPSIMLSNQVVASTQVTTPVAITKPVASLVGVVSKPITTSLTSTVSKPVTTSLFVTPTKPLFPAKDVTVNNVNVTKTVEATHQSKTKEEIDKIFALKIREECINLEASVKSLLHKSKTIHTNIGSEEEATKMANNTNELFTFLKEVTDTYKIQASEVHCLKQSLIQTWAWYEDAHSRFSVRKDSAMQAVIKLQPLDPASVKQLADIKHLLYYIESQLHQVNGALDEQWNNFQDSCKKTIKFKLPATETIYQSMVRQNAIIQKQSYVLKDIATRLKLSQNCKLGPALLVSLNKNDNLEDQLQKLEIEPKDALQMYYEKILERQLKLTSSKSTILKKLIKSRDINHVAVNKPKFVNAEQTLSFLSETISPIIAKKKEIVQSTPLIQENTTKAALPKILFSQKSEAVEITSSTKPEDTTTLKFDVPSAFVPTLSQQTSTPFAAKNTAQTLFLPQTTTPKTTVIFGAPTSTFTFTITSTCSQDEVPKQTASTVTSAFKPQVVTAVSSASAPVFNLMKEVSKSAETKGVSSFTFVFTTTQSATTTTAFTFFSSPKPIPTTSALTSTNSIEKTKNALTIFTPPTSLAATEGSSVSSIFTTTTQPTGSIFNIPAISSTQSSSSFALPSTSLKSLFTSVSTTASSAFQSPTLESIGNKSTFGGGFAITPVTTTITESSSVVASSSNDSTLFSSVSKPSSTFENSTSMFGRVQISVTGSSSPSTTSTPFTMTPSLFTVASTASSPFGATTTNSSSIFGVGSTTNNFGTTTTTSSPFGMVVTTSGSIFGATVSSTPLSFTTTGSANSTSFGKAISTTSSVPFGTVVNTSSPFGASVSTTSTDFEKITSSTSSTFGSPVNNTPAFGTIASTSSSIFGISTTTATSPFTAAVNTTSPFGATATITAVSFGAAPTTTIATFGAVATTTIAPFGAAGNTTTSPFGVTASTTAAPFGGTVTTTAAPFGVSSNTSTSPFGVITSTTPAPFGVVANTTATPFGSSSNTTTSPFGGNTFGTTPVSSAAVPFGSSGNFGSSAFGTNASSPFGASSKSVFGASATIASPFSTSTSTTASPFATNNTSNAFSKSFSFSVAAANIPSTSTFSFGKSPFGFGNTSSSDGGLSFGSLNVSTTAGTGFGTGFGQTQNQQQNPFDKISPSEQKSPFSGGSIFATPATSASTGSIFGNTNTSPFNKTPAFGSSAFGTQTFGQQSAFGQQSTFGSGNAFASQQTGPFSGGTQTVSQAGFGSPQSSFGKSASAFGASPTFGGAPAFGSTPAFGGAPSFGSSPTFGGMNKVFPSSPTGK